MELFIDKLNLYVKIAKDPKGNTIILFSEQFYISKMLYAKIMDDIRFQHKYSSDSLPAVGSWITGLLSIAAQQGAAQRSEFSGSLPVQKGYSH